MLRDCMLQVLYCPVHMGPMGAMVEGTMDDLKGLVGGEVELLHVLPGIMAAVNEHYVELDLPVNPWIHRGAYNGTVVFVGSPRRNTPYRALIPDDLAALCNAGILNRAEFATEEDVHGDCGV